MANAAKLKTALIAAWNKSIRDHIGSSAVPLIGAFATYVDRFDFRVFKAMPVLRVLEQHRKTSYFLPRFGGGLPARPKPQRPPPEIADSEMRYVQHLLDAYADHKSESGVSVKDLAKWEVLKDHFRRSREAFYHAESLHVFVRDKVEPGTFESLQEELYGGIADTYQEAFPDGYMRLISVTRTAQSLALDAHPLAASTFPVDRRGICHQLANEDRLIWTKK
ncbi:hypothetical protein MTX20_30130 [Bradyrhizobium sp. ISRA435]|nr:hypothetical protein MTX20_30130 [Bradyrhizobium sp. ISRA435]